MKILFLVASVLLGTYANSLRLQSDATLEEDGLGSYNTKSNVIP
jgi:hypothetical protein